MKISNISRRTFTKSFAALLPVGPTITAAVTSDLEWRRKCEKLAHRRRRLIYNDDGDARYLPPAVKNVADFLSRRFDWTKGSQVDSYYWCIGDGQDRPWGRLVPPGIGDPTRVMLEAARAAGQEAVISLRMNDIHDAFGEVSYPFKLQHRDMLIDPTGAKGKYTMTDWRYWYWSAMDYARAEVRQHKFDYISRICEQYLPDGLELDFMRHPMYFKKGEESANRSAMTEFVRKVRQRLEEIGRKHGRPILLSARLADTPEKSVKLGLDGPSWLKEGLLDVLIIGLGYFPYGDTWKQFAKLAEKHGVPAYPAYDCGLLYHLPQIELLRGAVTNWWSGGVPGIYLFNPFVPVDLKKFSAEAFYGELKRIGSPETLVGLDKAFCPDHFSSSVDPAQRTWGLAASAERGLPVKVSETARVFDVLVEETLVQVPKGKRRELALRVLASTGEAASKLVVKLNGRKLDVGKPAGQDWIEFPLKPADARRGLNEVAVASPQGETTVKLLQLWVRYRRC